MKIGIITLYDADNYGAYWQAKVLKDYLEERYTCKCVYIKTGARKKIVEISKKIKNSLFLKNFSIKYISHELKKSSMFCKYRKHIEVDSKKKEYSCLVFGSDEIWNLEKKSNRKHPIFWGEGFDVEVPRIAYAPSINNTTKTRLKSYKEGIMNLKEFMAIGVRDVYTKEMLQELVHQPIRLVVDPTFLVSSEYYLNKEIHSKKSDKYILVYSYGENINQEMINKIKVVAQNRKLKLVSVGNYLSWCDKSIICSPEEFLGYIHNAYFILTDTFHGTVFSCIYRANVGIFLGSNRKVRELVKLLSLNEFVIYDDSILEYRIDHPMDWDIAYKMVDKLKLESKEYLESSVGKCMQNDNQEKR